MLKLKRYLIIHCLVLFFVLFSNICLSSSSEVPLVKLYEANKIELIDEKPILLMTYHVQGIAVSDDYYYIRGKLYFLPEDYPATKILIYQIEK